MGLAAARRFVESSSGSIRCTSQVGVGTTFEIILPVVDDEASFSDRASDPTPPRGSATVVIAEDDDGLRRLMCQVLRRNGYEVLESSSAEEALDVARSHAAGIDLVVSDVVMGAMGGRELAETLQAEVSGLRVLLISGTANASITAGLAEGTSDFLAKPFKPSELIDRVHELLARRR